MGTVEARSNPIGGAGTAATFFGIEIPPLAAFVCKVVCAVYLKMDLVLLPLRLYAGSAAGREKKANSTKRGGT